MSILIDFRVRLNHPLFTPHQIRVGIRSSFHFASAPWPEVSSAAKHMVKQLLDVDPQRRLTVAGALKHPWMQGEAELEEEAFVPMHRPLAPLEEISEYSDDEEYGSRRPNCAPEAPKRQRVAPAAAPLPTPLQAHVMNNRPMPPPPPQPQFKPAAGSLPQFKPATASQPQFKQPHLPSRVAGAPAASGRGGRTGPASSRFGALNIKMS